MPGALHRYQYVDDATLIKAWTESEGKKDQEILAAAVSAQPRWPWSRTDDFLGWLTQANE